MREKVGMRRSDIMLVNIAVWVNSEKNLRSNITMWADYYSRHKQHLPFVIWRDASVQHFNTPTGARSLRLRAQTHMHTEHLLRDVSAVAVLAPCSVCAYDLGKDHANTFAIPA